MNVFKQSKAVESLNDSLGCQIKPASGGRYDITSELAPNTSQMIFVTRAEGGTAQALKYAFLLGVANAMNNNAAEESYKQGYEEGVKAERERIAQLLGLDGDLCG